MKLYILTFFVLASSNLLLGQAIIPKGSAAAFAPAEVRSKQKGADGVIANNLLRRFNLIFDYSNKKLFIKPNSHFSEPFV